jgi:hypothetical protein
LAAFVHHSSKDGQFPCLEAYEGKGLMCHVWSIEIFRPVQMELLIEGVSLHCIWRWLSRFDEINSLQWAQEKVNNLWTFPLLAYVLSFYGLVGNGHRAGWLALVSFYSVDAQKSSSYCSCTMAATRVVWQSYQNRFKSFCVHYLTRVLRVNYSIAQITTTPTPSSM